MQMEPKKGSGMTIFAGVIARRQGGAISDVLRDELLAALSRKPIEQVQQYGGADWCLLKVDIGAYGKPAAHRDCDGVLSVLAGDPLLFDQSTGRDQDLAALHQQWREGDWSGLVGCRGTYAAAQFDPLSRRLTLVGDKLGVRPLYFWCGADHIVFSSVFRVMEQFSLVKREIDLRGLVEKACFGFSLADRTVFRDVHAIYAGEVAVIDAAGLRRERYWRWDELPANNMSEDQLAAELHERFNAAVRRRLRGDRAALSFLSGGLDSRAIVTSLVEVGTHVHTLNFAPVGTQDELFGKQIAERLGTRHLALPQRSESFGEQQKKIFELWHNSLQPDELLPEHPSLVWSGDGGSVGVGHVYMTPETVRRARESTPERVAQALLERLQIWLPHKLIKANQLAAVADIPLRGVMDELADLHCDEPGRAPHLFLMHNDQRRHLADHYENIDVRRVELQLPFFDADFLQLILTSPIDGFLRHHFYNRWLQEFLPAIREVPWQAYPGHEPCPLPAPEGLRYQWDDVFTRDVEREQRRRAVQDGLALLRDKAFPTHLLNRRRLGVMVWAMRLGLLDSRYAVTFARPFVRHWRQAHAC